MRDASNLPAEIRVETVSDYQEFLPLEPVWNEVAEAAGTKIQRHQ